MTGNFTYRAVDKIAVELVVAGAAELFVVAPVVVEPADRTGSSTERSRPPRQQRYPRLACQLLENLSHYPWNKSVSIGPVGK